MPSGTVPYGHKTQRPSPVSEVHIVWITAGLGCDGDSVSITAATQPSIEDVLLGAIPGLPKVHLHNPVLAYECGEDFHEAFLPGGRGQARTLCAGGGRLHPQREDQEGRLLGGDGNRPRNQAAHHDHRLDRPAFAQSDRGGRDRHLRDLRWDSRHGGKSRQAAWAWRITWVGTGAPKRACRS